MDGEDGLFGASLLVAEANEAVGRWIEFLTVFLRMASEELEILDRSAPMRMGDLARAQRLIWARSSLLLRPPLPISWIFALVLASIA